VKVEVVCKDLRGHSVWLFFYLPVSFFSCGDYQREKVVECLSHVARSHVKSVHIRSLQLLFMFIVKYLNAYDVE
jgi:hypothetical protein